MDRRHALAALAASAFAPAALAQTAQPAPSPLPAPAPGTQPGSAANMAMGDAEMRHMQDTMMAGAVALETSNVALEKARNAEVKQFAKFEKAEQEGIADVLKSMMAPGAAPPKPDAAKMQMVEKMKGMQAGTAFDKAYIEGQIEGHQELLRIQEQYLQAGRNREHVNVAKLARGHIKEHIEELQDIEKKMRS